MVVVVVVVVVVVLVLVLVLVLIMPDTALHADYADDGIDRSVDELTVKRCPQRLGSLNRQVQRKRAKTDEEDRDKLSPCPCHCHQGKVVACHCTHTDNKKCMAIIAVTNWFCIN